MERTGALSLLLIAMLALLALAQRASSGLSGLITNANPKLPSNRSTGQKVAEFLNASAFHNYCPGPNGPFNFGNAGWNIVDGPGINNWDFALYREFPIKGETKHVEFRPETFNLFNHPIFGQPGGGRYAHPWGDNKYGHGVRQSRNSVCFEALFLVSTMMDFPLPRAPQPAGGGPIKQQELSPLREEFQGEGGVRGLGVPKRRPWEDSPAEASRWDNRELAFVLRLSSNQF